MKLSGSRRTSGAGFGEGEECPASAAAGSAGRRCKLTVGRGRRMTSRSITGTSLGGRGRRALRLLKNSARAWIPGHNSSHRCTRLRGGMPGTDGRQGRCSAMSTFESASRPGTRCAKVREIVNDALASLDAEFDRLYAAEGRPSIAPERLLCASLLQILFSVP